MVRTKNVNVQNTDDEAEPSERLPRPQRVRRNEIIPLPWDFRDREHEKRYIKLMQLKPLGDTRFIDSPALRTLGIIEDVYMLLDRVGWRRFVSLYTPTYSELVYEFLSSLEITLRTNVPNDPGLIRFNLMGAERYLCLDEFNSLFGFQADGMRKRPRNFNHVAFWEEITGKPYKRGETKVSMIRRPAFRYIHRLMSHTIFGRGESNSKVSQPELFFLWCMENSQRVNTGVWLLAHFKKMSNPIRGKLVGGGLITHIANFFGFRDLTVDIEQDGEVETVDITMCTNMNLCIHRGEQYQLVYPGRQDPDPDMLSDSEMGQPDDPDAEHDDEDAEGQGIGADDEAQGAETGDAEAEAEDDGAPIPMPPLPHPDLPGVPPYPAGYFDRATMPAMFQQMQTSLENYIEARHQQTRREHATFARRVYRRMHRMQQSLHIPSSPPSPPGP